MLGSSYLNVQLLGLNGRPHPALQNIFSTQDAKKLRIHLKFLTSDYLTNQRLSMMKLSSTDKCCLCHNSGLYIDSIEHVLTTCRATSDVRERLFPELVNSVASVQPSCRILDSLPTPDILTQFILDCTSIKLPDCFRIPAHNPSVGDIFRISRDWCYAVNSERLRLLRIHSLN